eukprot:2638685-Pyramimonas_sp.AAC.1
MDRYTDRRSCSYPCLVFAFLGLLGAVAPVATAGAAPGVWSARAPGKRSREARRPDFCWTPGRRKEPRGGRGGERERAGGEAERGAEIVRGTACTCICMCT